MSKNHIKIFDDTVLKQSINQGTELQRIATNLGRFTMGELAFTRDTGRVFVGIGSSTNPTQTDDSKFHGIPEVLGGILTGNKYLGYIDSKPLSWWKRGDYASIPLNYDSETTYKNNENESSKASKEEYTLESSMLGKDSKYRNKTIKKDANGVVKYDGKWQRDAIYNDKYDAYNGDYLYDMYQNALILFDTNISEKSNNISGVVEGEEQFYDNDGNKLPIDEQFRRTKIQNLNDNYHLDHPVYGDGYVIFRNIEVDGKTIKFKDKVFNSDGSTNVGSKVNLQSDNFSHNIIEVNEVGGSAMIGALSKDHFQLSEANDTISLKDIISEVHGFSNADNSFSLPQIITLTSDTSSNNKKTEDITLDFSHSSSKSIIEDGDFTLKLTQKVNSSNNEGEEYIVSVAKQLSDEYYIRLDEGLVNTGGGASDYIKISKKNAGYLGETCPKISLSSNENLTFNENNLNDPFYTLYESDSGNFYNGNMTFNASGRIEMIDDYEDDYKRETISEREKFDSEKNIKVNMLKNPIPIMWTGKHTQTTKNEEIENPDEGEIIIPDDKFDANLEYIIKPYFYCINKEVGLNGAPTITSSTNVDGETIYSGDLHNNSVIVLGNNHYEAKNISGNYFIIPGYNCDFDTELTKNEETGEVAVGGKILKCVFESISTSFDADVECGAYDEEIIDGVSEVMVFNDSILNDDDSFNTNILAKLKAQIGEANPKPELLDDINDGGYKIENGTLTKIINPEGTSPNNYNYYFDIVDVDDIEGNELLKEYIEKNITNDKINNYFSYKNFKKVLPVVDINILTDEPEEGDTSTQRSLSEITENTERVSLIKQDSNILKVELLSGKGDSFTLIDIIEEVEEEKLNTILNITKALDKKINHIEQIYEKYNTLNAEDENFSPITFDVTSIAYYDIQYGLVWSKASTGHYIASLYQNHKNIVGGSEIPVALKTTLNEEGEEYGIEKISYLKNMIPYYKSFTLYKKPHGNNYYYTIAKEDTIFAYNTNRYIAQIVTERNGIINRYTPEEFWEQISNNGYDIKKDERTGMYYSHLDITDTTFFGENLSCDNITFIIAVEDEIETDKTKYYKKKITDDNGNFVRFEYIKDETIASSENPKGPAPSTIPVTTFDIESFVLTPVCWSKNGYHTPFGYNNNLSDKLNDKMTVVIPDHANEVILEVRHQTASNNPIALFTSKNIEGLTKIINDSASSNFNCGFDSIENPYDANGNLIIPEFETSNTNFMLPNQEEKCLLYTDTNEVKTIRVPLYRSNYESGKMFTMRVSGIKASDEEKLMIRLIGYSL